MASTEARRTKSAATPNDCTPCRQAAFAALSMVLDTVEPEHSGILLRSVVTRCC